MLEERLRLVRIEKYGPGSEKLSDLQLELLEQEPGVSNVEVEAESQREAVSRSAGRQRSTGKHPGRQELPAHLPRVERQPQCAASRSSLELASRHVLLLPGRRVRVDPKGGIFRGRDEIDRIAGLIKATHPDFEYQPLFPPEELGDAGRVRWVSGTPGKPPAYAGTDFIVARNGRIASVYLFFDNLP